MLPKKDNKIPRYVNLITNLNLLDCELGFPSGSDNKESTSNAGDAGSILGWEDPVEEEMTTCSSILVWEIPWSLVGYSPWGHKESDTTEGLNHNTLPQRLLQRGDSATLPGSHEP